MASDLLARAFRRLPSLKGIHIRHADRSIGVKEAIGTLGVPSGFELGHNAELTVDILMRARRDAKLDLQSLRLSYAVASVAGEDVIDWTREEYDPDDNRPENTILKVSSRQPSTKDFQSVIGDFENFPPLMTLKTFEVTCLESTAHPRTGLDHFWLGALDIIEVNCSTLVSLKIDGGFDPEFGDHFMNCLSEMPIHVLRRLSLSEIYVKKCEHYLKLFAHSTSLIEMYLNGAIISSPRGWTRVVEWLRATKIHKPVRMVLKDCLPLEAGGHQAIDIGPYIGRKTRTNPLDDINDDGRY
ncbi:uncharacterized protein KY384_004711 [Bacidia gigantensis]|uniref:uncharacterized protein n=1 Tax=Bacidia gigantensis TaxID=2732470 RepID=UPI001D04CCE3|nr:uncharacterized protein KY384_004711 [Bacidia gigantensis]KAG8530211.1 hypothetical protein KY384_004711 [Bacidia gigantensis]